MSSQETKTDLSCVYELLILSIEMELFGISWERFNIVMALESICVRFPLVEIVV